MIQHMSFLNTEFITLRRRLGNTCFSSDKQSNPWGACWPPWHWYGPYQSTPSHPHPTTYIHLDLINQTSLLLNLSTSAPPINRIQEWTNPWTSDWPEAYFAGYEECSDKFLLLVEHSSWWCCWHYPSWPTRTFQQQAVEHTPRMASMPSPLSITCSISSSVWLRMGFSTPFNLALTFLSYKL